MANALFAKRLLLNADMADKTAASAAKIVQLLTEGAVFDTTCKNIMMELNANSCFSIRVN
ncbi:hypothetical protein [Pontibacter burrus]|uniref:Uncharacterized protein n=1 Tax=Pontibacter burrus TaxID=2704466 RepID=A0A6B3LYD9_9BACT|nr:hypothetical protein [Pontibacter burrus]NEM98501.1 hypothetical protein [Pontibacter burrus]